MLKKSALLNTQGLTTHNLAHGSFAGCPAEAMNFWWSKPVRLYLEREDIFATPLPQVAVTFGEYFGKQWIVVPVVEARKVVGRKSSRSFLR